MNREHLFAFVWLRSRLRANQLRRGGVANVVILALAAAALAVAAVGTAFGGFALGLFAFRDAPPVAVLLAWDGLVGVFLFVWAIGLLADLQRSEALSVEKVLHLPVSPAGAFLVNYLSSLVSLTMMVFLPGFVGLTLGLAGSRGAQMLLVLPVLVAFLFAVTALTYQFQGWLAALVSNPRRKRTVVVLLTGGFVLVAQAPQLVNILWSRGNIAEGNAAAARQVAAFEASTAATREATRALEAKEITADAHRARVEAIERDRQAGDAAAEAARAAGRQADVDRWTGVAWLANAVVPPLWLPHGAGSLSDGNPLPALLGALAFTAVGALSLRRAYRTTLKLVTGEGTGGAPTTAARATTPADTGPRRVIMAEWRLPWVGEPAAAVAAAGLRSLLRAPEAKMVLFAPLLFVIIFGSLAASVPVPPPTLVRPLLAAAGVGLVILVSVQLVGNQFGYDRGGFRAFVLSPAPRRDVLLGKNLAVAPLVLGLAWLVVLLVFAVFPMRADLLLAVALQAVAMFLVFLVLANALSILAPLPIAAGAMQPTGVRFTQVLGQLILVALLPVAAAPTFLPLAAEAVLVHLAGLPEGWPVALALSAAMLAGVAALYRVVLGWQGRLLAAREQDVLRVVTSKEE